MSGGGLISAENLALFALACVALAATPGPNVALIVATALKHGRRAGMLSAAGVNVGLVLQLTVVAAGLAWLVEIAMSVPPISCGSRCANGGRLARERRKPRPPAGPPSRAVWLWPSPIPRPCCSTRLSCRSS
ncbi:MAG: hypothetical protein B7X67_18625 [Rhizobiales bacterium 39-66-18]|nr:MAG: hypothetical protein B7X67_18625 [Rhizobiales bacterium 39-66-18]